MTTVPAALNAAMSGANQSDVIDLAGVNPTTCTEISMSAMWSGGKLIFSDSPETPTVHGKLYSDTSLAATSGSSYNRVFLYHVNGHATKKMRFSALLKNLGTTSGSLVIQKNGSAGPTTSYLYAGKLAFQRYLSSSAGSTTTVASNSWVQLDSTFGALQASTNNLLHQIVDYSFTQPHEIRIVAVYSTEDPITIGTTLSLLSRDSHQRGTFPSADKVYDFSGSIDTINDIQQFPLAGGTANDAFATGSDVTDGTAMTLSGNYGILYRMHFSLTSSDGRNAGFLINPRGGAWGGAVYAPAGITPGGRFLMPTGTTSVSSNASGSVEGKYNPSSSAVPFCQWMATGGSSLPVRFVLIPYTP